MINSKFEIGGDASAAAGPVGRHASADTDWKLNTEILTYSRARGLFAGLTLTGADVRRDDDSTEAIYGHEISTRRILRGELPCPPRLKRSSMPSGTQKRRPSPRTNIRL